MIELVLYAIPFFFLAMGFNGCLLMLRSSAGDSAEQS